MQEKNELMYNDKLTLREVFNAYCSHNGISVNQACATLGIPWTTLASWVRGERNLKAKNASKVRDFLHGRYIIDEAVIVAWLEGRKADEGLTDCESVI